MANQFKFVGIDNSTTGGALTPFGDGIVTGKRWV